MVLKPATPGFIVTLVATILLAVVSFSVPLIKSVYFLKASFSQENVYGTVEFGTLGYCLTISGVTTCSNATVGYEFSERLRSPLSRIPHTLHSKTSTHSWGIPHPSRSPKSW